MPDSKDSEGKKSTKEFVNTFQLITCCNNNTWGWIKCITKINLTCLFRLLRKVASRKLKITYAVCLIFLLDDTVSDVGQTSRVQSCISSWGFYRMVINSAVAGRDAGKLQNPRSLGQSQAVPLTDCGTQASYLTSLCFFLQETGIILSPTWQGYREKWTN